MLVLFTKWWALQQYEVPQHVLCGAIARCAERGDEALWECIEGDFDVGRVNGAVMVSLYMPDVAKRLPRLFESVRSGRAPFSKEQLLRSAEYHGVPVPFDVQNTSRQLAPATFEECRSAWPKERDQSTLDEGLGRGILNDQDAHALCRKFHPTRAEVLKVLDWAIARPEADKLRWLFLLCTDYQLGKDYERWNEVADMLAAIDMAPVWKVIEGDWEYSRLMAAASLVCRGSDRTSVKRLVPQPTSTGEFQRRKANWPAERDWLPRPTVVHLIHDTRPELEYSTEPTGLTRSLDRICEWLNKANLKYPVSFRPGITQTR